MQKYNLPNERKLIIETDDCPEDPRGWDNLGTMACFHDRYRLGDKDIPFSDDDFDSWEEMKEHAVNTLKAAVILPLYMYDHSGITINTTGFSCNWDSGQIGFIYVTETKLKEEYGDLSEETLEKAKKNLLSEVETYDQYITGEVYHFRIEKENVCNLGHIHSETEDSCGGFYGDDIKENGILDHISEEDSKAVLAQL